ncbi:hypothetical protein T484DRAFT_1778636 [Baffinella frigidus]|nr:hypothetical protein T484DRAFT_1778636 [Cryptophyta sp. CCMP2293]
MVSNTMVRAAAVTLCLAVTTLLLAEGIPASAAPAHCQPRLLASEKALPHPPFEQLDFRRKVEAAVDWLKGIAGGENRFMKEIRLISEDAEEAARCAKAASEDRSNKAASAKAEMLAATCTGCALLLATMIAKAGHFLHANTPLLVFIAKAFLANPRTTCSVIIFLTKVWFFAPGNPCWSSPLVVCIATACRFLHNVMFALGKAYSAAHRTDKKEATIELMPASSSGEQPPAVAAMEEEEHDEDEDEDEEDEDEDEEDEELAGSPSPLAGSLAPAAAHVSPAFSQPPLVPAAAMPDAGAMPDDVDFRSPAKTSPSWHFTSCPEWHFSCSPVATQAAVDWLNGINSASPSFLEHNVPGFHARFSSPRADFAHDQARASSAPAPAARGCVSSSMSAKTSPEARSAPPPRAGSLALPGTPSAAMLLLRGVGGKEAALDASSSSSSLFSLFPDATQEHAGLDVSSSSSSLLPNGPAAAMPGTPVAASPDASASPFLLPEATKDEEEVALFRRDILARLVVTPAATPVGTPASTKPFAGTPARAALAQLAQNNNLFS